jgi:SagB-type dehydrogenase family enzyme
VKKLLSIFLLILFATGGVLAVSDIKLPNPDTIGKMPLETAIYQRRSIRSFTDKDLSMEQISQLLWAAQGITDKKSGFRSAPSAGALYPITIYLAKNDGLFEYIPKTHSIRMISDKDLRGNLASASLGQRSVSQAAVDIIITANYKITQKKYGSRMDMYVWLETGHIAQNVLLQAVALGLASVPIGVFNDSQVKSVIKTKDPLYILPIGYSGK